MVVKEMTNKDGSISTQFTSTTGQKTSNLIQKKDDGSITQTITGESGEFTALYTMEKNNEIVGQVKPDGGPLTEQEIFQNGTTFTNVTNEDKSSYQTTTNKDGSILYVQNLPSKVKITTET